MLINGKMDKLWSIHRWGRLYSNASKPPEILPEEREKPDTKEDFLDDCICIKYKSRQN